MNRSRRRQMEALRDHIFQQEPIVRAPAQLPSKAPPRSGRPISFNDEMIRALLTGRKTQTRRLVDGRKNCPFGGPGDLLWVRERWTRVDRSSYRYSADAADDRTRFRPTFHMPRAACRIVLRIASVEMQSLQSMSTADARNEGYDPRATKLSPRKWFADLWDRIFRAPGTRWADNPRVWMIRFELVSPVKQKRTIKSPSARRPRRAPC